MHRWDRLVFMVAIAALAITVACVPHRPGRGVTPEFAQEFGCDYDEIVRRAEALEAQLKATHQYIPRVGWDACDLLAHNGKPSDIDYQQFAGSQSMSWWYSSEFELHLVSLELQAAHRRGSPWIVTYVGW